MISDEKILIERVIGDDHVAFAILYKKYQPIVLRFICKFLKSHEISSDTCQEVFIKIWELRHTLGEVNSFKAFLFTIAKNHTLNILKRATLEYHLRSQILYNFTEGRKDVDDQVQSEEYNNHIINILRTLPPKTREMFELCRVQGKTYDEAAKVMGISRNTVKKHMVNSLKALRYAVAKDFGIFFSMIIGVTL